MLSIFLGSWWLPSYTLLPGIPHFLSRKKQFPSRILSRSIPELDRKSHGYPLGIRVSRPQTTDFSRLQYLIQSVIRQISELHYEQSFTMIYDQVSTSSENNSIDLVTGDKVRRVRSIPSRFKDVIMTSTIGHRDHFNSEAKYRTNYCFPLCDSMLVELKDRFSEKRINVLWAKR